MDSKRPSGTRDKPYASFLENSFDSSSQLQCYVLFMEGINNKAVCKSTTQTSRVGRKVVLVNVIHRESHLLFVDHYLEYLLISLSKLDRAYVDFTNIYLNSLISHVIYHMYMTTLFLLLTWKNIFSKREE